MKQDNTRDFDLQIRSMLEEAEIKPSRRVWKGISARMDGEEAASRAASGVWMRWAGACLAVAAIAAGLVFSGTFGKKEISIAPLVADNLTIPEAGPSIDDSEDLFRGQLSTWQEPDSFSGPSRNIATDDEYMTVAGQKEQVNAAPAGNGMEESREEASSIEKQPASRKAGKTASEAVTADPFAVLEMQERQGRRRMRTALYAKGAVSGNDSDFSLSPKVYHMAPGASGTGIQELSTSTYGVPFTVGLGVRLYVLPRLSIGTGLDYSLLTRTFTGKYTGVSDGVEISEAGNVYHELQYLGIPLDVYYDIFDSGKLKFYVYAGGEAELCVSNKYTMFTTPAITRSSPVQKLQYSAGLGLGVEFALSDRLGLYLDPAIRYYFNSDQPKSVRTDKPLMVNFDAGLRFNF